MSVFGLVLAIVVGANGPGVNVGRKIDDFRLQDFRGASHALSDIPKEKLVVVAFLGTECPLAKLYAPRLNELAQEFETKGVQFVAVLSNRQDAIKEIEHFAKKQEISYPVLKDAGNAVADQFGAERTPEIFVLDQNRVVRYHGRVDDQFGVGYLRPAPTRSDLKEALNELLAGKEVSVAKTPAPGCFIGRVKPVDEHAEVTYSNQIARIFQKRCVECHRPGQIAPFSLTSYEESAGWAET
ncbi:MAG: thioredoxin family protein, partial [Planctomycetota bacterium]